MTAPHPPSSTPRILPVGRKTTAGKAWRTPPDMRFVEDNGMIPVTCDEAPKLAAHVPILIRRIRGKLEPVAIFKLYDGQAHSVLDADGKLLKGARPYAAALYPFVPAPSAEAGKVGLGFDTASGLLVPDWDQDAHGFFDQNGEPTPKVQKIAQAMAILQRDLAKARQAAQALHDHDCLIPVTTADADKTPKGIWGVNIKAVDALRGEALEKLHKSGALALAYAHLSSLEPLRKLLTAGMGGNAPEDQTSPVEDTGPSGFLSALAGGLNDEGQFDV